VKYVADPYNQLPAITFWLLGSLTGVLPRDLPAALLPMIAGLVPLVLLRWRIDALALSQDEARSLGLPVGMLRLAVIVCATLVTAAAVSLAGTIGWVGLVIPHAARLLVGAPFGRVLPLSLVLGAAFMLAVDTMCRTAFGIEVPPGVVTAFVGTPVFIVLLAVSFRRSA
jgi:iron complex transport system permease protein